MAIELTATAEYAKIHNIIGPKGDDGAPGKDGDKGEPGEKGAPGEKGEKGDSAYQVAVKNGFTGTEREWLTFLKGEKGEPGGIGVKVGISQADLLPEQASLTWDGKTSAGTVASADRASDFVAVEQNVEYTLITAVSGSPWSAICFYNSNKAMIGSRVAFPQPQNEGMLPDGKVLTKITLPSFTGAAFARVAYRSYHTGELWFGKTAEMPVEWQLKLAQVRADNNAPRPAGFKLVGHRGAEFGAPENTARSYIRAKELGITMAECDVRKTADGVFILMHDTTIFRTARLHNASGQMVTTNLRTAADSAELYDRFGVRHTTYKTIVDTPVEQLSFAELDRFDYSISYEFSRTGGVHPILKLEDFAKLCKRIGLHPYVELRDHSEEDVKAICDIFINHGLERNMTFVAFSGRMLTFAHKYAPNSRKGWITDQPLNDQTKFTSQKEEFGDKGFISLNYIHLNEDNITASKATGTEIEVWTVTTLAQLNQVSNYVSGVSISDSLTNSHLLYGLS